MLDPVLFLHLTDTHLSSSGTPHNRDDHKVKILGIDPATREGMLDFTLGRLAERLVSEGRHLDGVIFSGDAQIGGRPGGHRILFDLIIKHFAPLGVTPSNIVAVPGNHDVPMKSAPGSPERYQAFVEVWRDEGCITPWLDGVDTNRSAERHHLQGINNQWAVFPINSCNWSHVEQVLEEPLASAWKKIPALLSDDKEEQQKFRKQLDRLAVHDMARISEDQLEELRWRVNRLAATKVGTPLRIAVMHHHLRAPSMREEVKAFADFSNLEQIRSCLRDSGFRVVVHGHKHEHALHYDYTQKEGAEGEHRTLVISGATFSEGQDNAVRLIEISGLPYHPTISVEPISLGRSGVNLEKKEIHERTLDPDHLIENAPIVISGVDIDDVYARSCRAASNASGRTLIVFLDIEDGDGLELPLPTNYPLPSDIDGEAKSRWLKELVQWWQMERSQLEHRMPFVHGGRLRRYGGKIDQIDRIIKLLRSKASTRALAILVDPFRDFTPNGSGEEFASFCLVEFKRRGSGKAVKIDAIAFYRAQEFISWWPVNVAELRYLQREISTAIGATPGTITTVAADARTHSRSPTQVAMPIVDRWLDQAPERLYLLADALHGGRAQNEAQKTVVRDWYQALEDLRASAGTFNPDGLPIAIDGLRVLEAYLNAINDGRNAEVTKIAQNLGNLVRLNDTFEKGSGGRTDFNNWSPTALELVSELKRLTDVRMRAAKISKRIKQ